jgi:hypothetical protein
MGEGGFMKTIWNLGYKVVKEMDGKLHSTTSSEGHVKLTTVSILSKPQVILIEEIKE